MRLKLFLIIIFLIQINLFAQTATWFPSDLNVQPFTANFLEPKAGFLFALGDDNIRLDIGTSRDIVQIFSDKQTLSFGADLFTYTRLRSEKDFHFPVETIDYLFGINAAYKKDDGKKDIGVRFRFSHISAHLVDGQFDKGTNQWRDGRLPEVYSREFVELFPYYRVKGARVYVGLTYIFHSSPKDVKKGIYQIGGDYFAESLISENISPFIAYDFKLAGYKEYVGNNSISAGVKFGKWDKKGFSIYLSYISGMSIHGEYLDLNESYSNIGFNLDL